jgi:hypothetical protein
MCHGRLRKKRDLSPITPYPFTRPVKNSTFSRQVASPSGERSASQWNESEVISMSASGSARRRRPDARLAR